MSASFGPSGSSVPARLHWWNSRIWSSLKTPTTVWISPLLLKRTRSFSCLNLALEILIFNFTGNEPWMWVDKLFIDIKLFSKHYKKSEGDSKRTFGAIPGRCILYRRSLISSRSVKCAPLGYSAPSSALPAGRGSISISLVAQGCT